MDDQSARVQTVLCIPVADGVVEFGSTEMIQEDLGLVRHVKTFFHDYNRSQHAPPPKPALSGHSTSNPATSSQCFHSPPPFAGMSSNNNHSNPGNNDEDEDEEEENEEPGGLDSEAGTGRVAGEVSELMQMEISDLDIRVRSPEDASNNLESDFNVLPASRIQKNKDDGHFTTESYKIDSARRWALMQNQMRTGGVHLLQPPPFSETQLLEDLTQEDSHYSHTVSSILHHHQQPPLPESFFSAEDLILSADSAFAKWTLYGDQVAATTTGGAGSQWLLKFILFTVPYLHGKYPEENEPCKSADMSEAAQQLKKGAGAPQEDMSVNHVLAERRRREKLNERFVILRSLVPFVTKMDKASILGDTIEYLKQLRRKIQDLEVKAKQMEVEQRSGLTSQDRTWSGTGSEKRKMRAVEVTGSPKPVTVVEPPPPPPPVELLGLMDANTVQVSIIETDALVELQCPYREALLLDVMMKLRDLRIEVTAVQSSVTDGSFVAELRAKVKENVNGKKMKIAEVKRAIYQIIPE
uniref:BHLH domain-containing protein n=1 Tax=Kalanchoe fedtschenkoi TaxID=63787 RepID=A0A7N0SYA4_KALFE